MRLCIRSETVSVKPEMRYHARMHRLGKWLLFVGLLNLATVATAFALYSVAYASQYAGFVHWIATGSESATPGSARYEDIRTNVLSMLGRTSTWFMAVSALLLVNGCLLIVVGLRHRKQSSAER